MTTQQNTLKFATVIVLLLVPMFNAYGHGWTEFPNARQNICYEQGGIWSGNPPNAACVNAKAISGSYPFVQRNEFARNILDFNNINAVKDAVPDGTLCYANDPQKRGMGAAHTAWTRTELSTGTFELVFNATAPHNPSFWEFYLTTPTADLSKELAWGDLELIQSNGNVPVNGGKYRIDVTIPSGRSGDAILFVRWQRDDPAGEGFYNCSDITINDGDATIPTPEPVLNEYLQRGDLFVPGGLDTPQIGDTVTYDIVDQSGAVERSFDILLDYTNVNDWARLLASEINGWHTLFKDGDIFIGDWHVEMQHYMYFQNDLSRNYLNSRDGMVSGVMAITNDSGGSVNPLTGDIFELAQSDRVVNAGDKVVLVTNEAATIIQTQGTLVQIENNNTSSIIIYTNAVTQDETLTFLASTPDGGSVDFTFEVIVDNDGVTTSPTPETETESNWDSSKIYLGGEIVTYAEQQWIAQWWVEGGDNPESTYRNNLWGVWRPVD